MSQPLNAAQQANIWNQYLAGLIDGDGSLLISQAGFVSLEITMDINDLQALNLVKQKLGGSVKRRNTSLSFRYRLHNKAGMLDVISRVNGEIRQSNRMVQLQKICALSQIPYQAPQTLDSNNAWFAGFFDADGTIGYSYKKGWPQLTISVGQKLPADLACFQNVFGGTVRLDSRSNIYKWAIYSEVDIQNFYKYCRKFPLYSHKKKRMFLLPRFYKLRTAGAHRSSDPALQKAWAEFETDWKTF